MRLDLFCRSAFAAATMLVLMTAVAEAHTGLGSTSGFLHGFVHPVTGLDHVLAMVTVGLLAARLGGRALWLVPSAFVAMMAVGGMLGITGVPVPFVEAGISASVLVLGLAVAYGYPIPATTAAALVAFFAIFHGHAHGAEMPADAAGLAYGGGFVTATALLHILGIGLGVGIALASAHSGKQIARVGGGALAAAALGLLAGVI